MQEVKRENKAGKIFWIIFGAVLITIGAWFFGGTKNDNNLHLYFLDVGQGDSIYARRMNNFDLLIDCGPDSDIVSKLGEVMPFWDRKIDYLLLTHPHADHLSGCIDVLKRYEIGQIIATDALHSTAEYQQWLELIKDKKIPYKLARAGQEISLDNEIKLNIYWPDESYQNSNIDNLNNTSIVAKLVYNKFSALFPSDAETEVQKSLLKLEDCGLKTVNCKLKTNILKVAHHGSSNAADLNFLKTVAPEIAIISVGKDNKFGHPTDQALQKLNSIGAQIFRTDQSGTIEITSNGQNFWTNTQK